MQKKEGFIYIWRDSKRNLYYIGSHIGSPDDGYIGSNNRLRCAYKSRPDTFKRKILEHYDSISHKELRDRENSWLSLIKDHELHRVRYYNEKKFAAGGDVISTLPFEKREQHKIKSLKSLRKGWNNWIESVSKEELSRRGKYARSKVKNHKGGVMPGDLNPFYGKTHSEQTRRLMSEKAKERKPTRTKEYIVEFSDGYTESHLGQSSILNKYCTESPIKISRFIDKNIPVSSKRKAAKNNKLLGATIRTVKET